MTDRIDRLNDGRPTRAERRAGVERGDRADAIQRIPNEESPRAPPRIPRYQQLEIRGRRAADLGVDPDDVGTRDTIGGGVRLSVTGTDRDDVRDTFASDFAADRPFVARDDVSANIDGQGITAEPTVRDDRREEIAERARPAAADELDAGVDDLRVGVDALGVLGVEVDRSTTVEDALADPSGMDLAEPDTFTPGEVFDAPQLGDDDDFFGDWRR